MFNRSKQSVERLSIRHRIALATLALVFVSAFTLMATNWNSTVSPTPETAVAMAEDLPAPDVNYPGLIPGVNGWACGYKITKTLGTCPLSEGTIIYILCGTNGDGSRYCQSTSGWHKLCYPESNCYYKIELVEEGCEMQDDNIFALTNGC